MNTNKVIGLIVLVLVVAVGVILGIQSGDTNSAMTGNDETMLEEEAMLEAEGVMTESGDTMMEAEGGAMESASGSYEAYSVDKLALAEEGDVVLFFKASWCPSCRALDADLKANADAIPAGVTILELDYDTATELKQKYGVTSQHTLVQVNANGELVKKWLGGNTLEATTAQII